jgi:hypothetical protein
MNSNKVTKIVTTKFNDGEGKISKIGLEMFNDSGQSLYEKEVNTKGKLIKELRTVFTHSNTRIIETKYNTNGVVLSKSEYDLSGKIISTFDFDIKTGVPKITLYKYNGSGLLSELVSDDNIVIMKYFENSDMISEICDENGRILSSYYYNIRNDLTRYINHKNGIVTDYYYNDENQIKSITHTYDNDADKIHVTEYTYHENGKEATNKEFMQYKNEQNKRITDITFTEFNDKGDRIFTEIIEDDKTVFKDSYKLYYTRNNQLIEIKSSNYIKQILYV